MAHELVENVGSRQSTVSLQNVAIIQHNPENILDSASESGLKRSSLHKAPSNTLHKFLFEIQCHQATAILAVRQGKEFANDMLTLNDDV